MLTKCARVVVCMDGSVREFTMGEIEHFVDPEDKSHPKLASVAGEVLTLFTAESQVGDGKTTDMTAGEAAARRIVNNETLTYYMTRTQQFLLKAGVNRGGLRWAVLTWRARRDRPGGRHDDDGCKAPLFPSPKLVRQCWRVLRRRVLAVK